MLPFAFLPPARRQPLVGRLTRHEHLAGEVILTQGEPSREVLLLAAGEVEVIRDGVVMSTVTAGHYVGERAALFRCPRQATIRVLPGAPAVTYALPGDDFLALIAESPVFAQALAASLTVKQGIFAGYQQLWARILSLVGQGGFVLSALLQDYAQLHPALHPLLHDARLDLGALSYAVNRLPEGVTETSFYYLTNHLPPLYADPDDKFPPVRTRARRRAAWRPIPGKCIVLLRDGMTDVTDLLTCLCAYAIEARKIRRRIRSPGAARRPRRPPPGPAARHRRAALRPRPPLPR